MSRLTRRVSSTAPAARDPNASASRRSSSEKRGSRPSLSAAVIDADRLAAHDERHPQPGLDVEHLRLALGVDLGILERRVDPLAAHPPQHVMALRPVRAERADQTARAFARGALHAQAAVGQSQVDEHHPRVEQLAQAVGHDLEQPVEIELGDERRCRARSSESSCRVQRRAVSYRRAFSIATAA